MTIYARGYRRYEGALDARGPRWAPILAEGYREAVRGAGFRVLFWFIVAITVIFAFFLYFDNPMLTNAFLDRGTSLMDQPQIAKADLASKNLEGAILLFDQWSTLFVMLLTLFAGSGLVANDVKARALPLYLVRPITPFDYYAGKLSILLRLLARAVLAPMLLLVAVAALLQPSDEMWDFLRRQDRLIAAILLYYLALALSYASLALLFSALTGRRIMAVVLGAVVFLGGAMVRGVLYHGDGAVVDVLRATSLSGDTGAILWGVAGRALPIHNFPRFASPAAATAVMVAVVLAAAVVVLRRARSVEVVA